jgi:hypothetical protein
MMVTATARNLPDRKYLAVVKKRKRGNMYVRKVRETRMIELTENISSQAEAIKLLQQQKAKYSNTEKEY